MEITNQWPGTQGASGKTYAVQTATKILERCTLMTTDPGELVFDPTCGSGTIAYVAEKWGPGGSLAIHPVLHLRWRGNG